MKANAASVCGQTLPWLFALLGLPLGSGGSAVATGMVRGQEEPGPPGT